MPVNKQPHATLSPGHTPLDSQQTTSLIVSRSYSTCQLTNNLTPHCLQVILHLPVNKQPHSLSPGHTPLACQQTTSLIVSRSYSTCLSTNNLTPHCLQVILHLPVNKLPHSTLSAGHIPLACQQTTSLHIVSRSYYTCLSTNNLTPHCLQVILHLPVNKQPHSLSPGHTPLACQQTTSLHIVSRSYSTCLSTNNLTPYCLQVILHLPVNKQPHSTLSPGHTPLACQQTTSLIVSRSYSTCLLTNNPTHCLQVILHVPVNKQPHSTLSPGHTPRVCQQTTSLVVSRSYSTCLSTNNVTHCLQVILHLPVNKQPHSTLSPGHTPLSCQQTTSLIVSRSYSTCLSTNNLTPHCLQVILHLPVNTQPHSLAPGHTPLAC